MTENRMLFEKIDITRIDAGDELFQLDRPDDSPLDWDITQPLFNPVWLHRKQGKAFRIVDGFRVVEIALTQTDSYFLPARVFPEDSSLLQLWEQRVRKRIQEDSLSVIAWLKGLKCLLNALDMTVYPADTKKSCLPSGMESQAVEQYNLDRILDKAKYFGTFASIHHLGFRQLEELSGYDTEELTNIGILLKGMQLKGKKLSSLMGLIYELLRGYGMQLQDLLSDGPLAEIRTRLQPHQRYRHVKSRLMALRFPQLNKLLTDWDEAVNKTGLKNVVDIRHDPYFEEEYLEFVFTARDKNELEQYLKTVLEETNTSGLKRLFDFI